MSTRQLAAIMFADMVGYTAFMQEDEVRARTLLDRQRQVLSSSVARHDGEVLQYYGDGTLSVFNSAVEAVECAVEIQRALRENPEVLLRIGVHIGDVIHDENGIYGDGVNVASRVEGLAPPGGVLISGKVFDEIKNHPDISTVSLGRVELKNVKDPLSVFAVTNGDLAVPTVYDVRAKAEGPTGPEMRARPMRPVMGAALLLVFAVALTSLLDREPRGAGDGIEGVALAAVAPSLAVLPFENLSTDEENGYFATGLHDEVITQLLRVPGLRVISRTSVMSYATDRPDPAVIAESLGVTYLTEASVQRIGQQLRVNVRLFDARTDSVLWSDVYPRELDDAFAVQSEIAQSVAEALVTNLSSDVRAAMEAPSTDSPEAYRLYLQARDFYFRPGYRRENFEVAQRLYEAAIALDPDYALARAELSRVHGSTYWENFDPSPERLAAQRAESEEALRLDPDLPQAHAAAAWVLYVVGEYEEALGHYRSALEGLPNDAEIVARIGYTQRRLGNWPAVDSAFRRATELSPRNATLFYDLGGHSFVGRRRYAEGVEAYNRALVLAPDLYDAAFRKGETYLHWQGQIDTLRAVVEALPADLHRPDFGLARVEMAFWDRDPDAMFTILGSTPYDVFESQITYLPKEIYEAWAYQLRGDPTGAAAAFESARAELEPLAQQRPGDGRLHTALGFVYAGLGMRAEAAESVLNSLGAGERTGYAGSGVQSTEAAAQILAQAGLAEEAVRHIRALLEQQSPISVQTLRFDPLYDPIRSDPAFQALLER